MAGSAGSGKTTLLRAGSVAATDRGYRVLATMPARSDVRLTFAGLSDLLEPYTDAVLGELPRPQARALRVALLLEEAPSHPPEPRLIATAFRTALTVLARTAPVLVVIDDVQWLDEASLDALAFSLRRVASGPLSLLVAARTEAVADPLTAGAPPPSRAWQALLDAAPTRWSKGPPGSPWMSSDRPWSS